MTAAENKINALFEELVPASGKAQTVAGEIIRAVTRIGYRNYNDGDHIGVGYGKETCNPAARLLLAVVDDKAVRETIDKMWGERDDDTYDALEAELNDGVLAYIETHPELKTAPNVLDMWSLRTGEDVDDEDEEEW